MLFNKKRIITLLVPLILVACNSNPQANTFSEKVAEAHNSNTFLANKAISFNLKLTFGGKTRLDGKLTLLTNSAKAKIEKKDGTAIYVNGMDMYVAPETDITTARFDAYTWSYFFLMPYKLNDSGTKWQAYENKQLNGETYAVEKLTFEAGTGDAPDDWYIIYADSKTMRLHAAAYIVTANKTLEEAESDPHAIVYNNYQEVEGIPIATEWQFYEWRAENGLTKLLGEATLSDFKFLAPDQNTFKAPDHFIKSE